ncbi:5-methylaminomethyl-2-thiouridine methyltransferase [Rhizobium sp. Leaf384]|uniref:tRNA (5-methylaminomethyl-2-thiouridine)(34)-methyltransferase MnmD n=1 Tax=unclassified Rhizobium TaxID=2613769 RepID=UPI000714C3D2|nr:MULTISPECIES: tRNA (5-methylaminomethyl-2-thiouridine)(34)-methyltransferase MnmD [unclassified Rhizobium]KQS77205.1 5-methylaminomethyl-2-thiouridine methyltransferase [Rhizobium sp. Leaf384]KQS78585.1 5-methylaminomethyl-2-thiouridine methyltransferase [Rhizobium sp. Leaf383]
MTARHTTTPADLETPSHQTLDWHSGDMPYSVEFDDHFYCRTDGRLECGHVFLHGNDLPGRWQNAPNFSIGELGFGTGLNFCETWRQWNLATKPAGARLAFTSFERFPMTAADIARALSAWPEIRDEREALIAAWPQTLAGTIRLDLSGDVTLTIVCGPALETVSAAPTLFDAWYLDGFAPSRNPDMWSAELMAAVHAHTADGGTFATYAAAGFVRRNLQAAGFQVERRQGFAGKREMLRGVRPDPSTDTP